LANIASFFAVFDKNVGRVTPEKATRVGAVKIRIVRSGFRKRNIGLSQVIIA